MFTVRAIAALCFFCYQSTALNVPDGSEPFYSIGYGYVPQQEAWYKVHRERRSWYDAYQICRLEGAALLYPRDRAEDTLLQQMAKDLPNDTLTWVGAHDFFADDIYVDLQGKEIPEYLARWSSGEPNVFRGVYSYHCIMKYHNGLIGIESCERDLPFVCKRSVQVVLTRCGTFDTGYLPNADSTRCYKVHKPPKTWKQAYKVCHAEGSYLVVIDDEEEAKFIVNLVKSVTDRHSSIYYEYNSDYTVVGFHDRFAEGDYVTVNGKNLDEVYNRWGEHEFDHYREAEKYGSLRLTDARLHRVDSYQTKTPFVCERQIENPNPQTTTPLQATTESSPSQ